MKLKIWELALIAALVLTVVLGVGAHDEARGLSEKLVRLHVVANSDSEEDQALKLRVRDAVLDYLRPRLAEAGDANEAGEIIRESLDGILGAAGEIADRPVTARLAREQFPTVEYDTFALPAGEYTSLRVVIGDGAGHNWWCVVFPPVCDAGRLDNTAAAAIGLSGEETKLITADGPEYVVKFRLMEWIGSFLAMFH